MNCDCQKWWDAAIRDHIDNSTAHVGSSTKMKKKGTWGLTDGRQMDEVGLEGWGNMSSSGSKFGAMQMV